MLILVCLQAVNAFLWPGQIHLSWTENPKEMRVTWLSRLNSDPLVELKSQCEVDKNISYSMNHVDFGVNTKRMNYVYSAVIQDLEPDCTYEYRVKNGAFSSDFHNFKGITHGDESHDLRKVVIFGDMGISSSSQILVNGMHKYLKDSQEIPVIFHVGDLAYDVFTNEGKKGDDYGEFIQLIASDYAYMTIPGNHEAKGNYSHYYNRYIMPKNEENQGLGLFYSLKIGLVRYICMNSNVFGWASQEEMDSSINWLKSELEDSQKNRDSQPWIVVLQHQPLYCAHNESDPVSYKDCIKATKMLRGYLEEIYYENKVDLVVSGHVHRYERNSAIYNNTDFSGPYDTLNRHEDPVAPIYIVSGNGGNYYGISDKLVLNEIEWIRSQHNEHGFGVLTSFNSSMLLWEEIDGTTLERLDYVYIERNRAVV